MRVSYTDFSKKREVWKELSAQISGKFKIILSNSNSHEALYLNYNYSNIDIELSESDAQALKVKFSTNTRNKNNISIIEKDTIDNILNIFSIKKIYKTGNLEFDNKYIIKADDESLIKRIITDSIQFLMLELKIYSINCKTNKNTEKFEFICVVNRLTNDIYNLKRVYQLINLIIDNLKESRILT